MLGLGALWLVALGPAWAGCDNASLQDHLAEARARYASQDEAGFRAAVAAADEDLGCLGEPLRRAVATEWHRTQALLTAVSGGPAARERVVGALRAGFELDPTIALFPGALPEAYWSARYEEARALSLSPATPPLAGPNASLSVDGVPGGGLRRELPALLQCSNSSGLVLWTRALAPGEATPVCEAPPPAIAAPQEPPVEPPQERCAGRLSRKASFGLAGGALGLAGASAGLYVFNRAFAEAYDQLGAEDGQEALEQHASLTNGTGTASVLTGVASLGAAGALALRGCF